MNEIRQAIVKMTNFEANCQNMLPGIEKRVEAFAELGNTLQLLVSSKEEYTFSGAQIGRKSAFKNVIERSAETNQWFTANFIMYALKSIASSLQKSNLRKWLAAYPHLLSNQQSKRIGVIMAGNIPFVGFHDFISVLITGNYFIGKPSSKEGELMKMIAGILTDIEPGYKKYISFNHSALTHIDALIATGSDNSSRYFDYNYKNIPSLIRKNRNGVAILNGSETTAELEELGKDIFLYFGLGCRNISKLFVPMNYDFNLLFQAFHKFKNVVSHPLYADNYRYQLAISKTKKLPFKDTGFMIVKESFQTSSPIATLFYQHYRSEKELNAHLDYDRNNVQCIVGNAPGLVPFGNAQSPELWNYADDVDIIKFLNSL